MAGFKVKFQGDFVDTTGNSYWISIYKKEEVKTIKHIRLGATPFVVDCDADENYFKPVRTRTAKMTVIDEDGTLYDQIMPTDNFSTLVALYIYPCVSYWFISCDSFEKPLGSRPTEVTFNLNNFLAMTEFVKADPIYSNTTTKYGLLRSIGKGFNDVGVSMNNCFWLPKMYNYDYIDYSWFFETKKYKDIDGDHVEIVGKSVLSIIESFCKFYGLVAIENHNGEVVFVNDLDLDSNNYQWCRLQYGQLPTITEASYKLKYIPVQWSDLVWMGTEQTVNTIRPAKSVSVVSKIEEYDNKVSLPSFAANAYHFGEIESRDAQYQCHSLMSDMNNIGGTLIMGKPRAFVVNLKKDLSSANSYYVNEYTITYNGEAEGAYPINASFLRMGYASYPISNNWDRIASNSFKLNADELTNAQVWCGAFMVRSEVYESPKKASFSLTDMLFVSGLCYSPIDDITPTLPEQFSKMKAATLRSDKIVKIYNGFVNIKASAKIIDYYGNFSDADGVVMNFQLKIGNRYYSELNGWTEDESFFGISFKDGKIFSNKTSLMQTSEETGFFIEIPAYQYQEGIVEFSVSPALWKSGSTNDGKLPMCAMFSDLSVNFTYKSSDLAFGDRENRFFAMLDAGAKDEIEVENDIASDCFNKAGENVLKDIQKNNAQVDSKKGIKPELLLLSRMKEYYSKRRNILSLEVGYGNLQPDTLYSVIWQDGKTYLPFGYSIDYKANKVNLKLFEQPDYPDDIIP